LRQDISFQRKRERERGRERERERERERKTFKKDGKSASSEIER